ncbi:MAG: polysaccharide biosynthesis protein [Clostridia bacterium]
MIKKQSFIKGTFILITANVFVKIIGAVFKIPLTNLIGASGISDFSIAYNLYAVMFVVSTAGLPVAISKLISEENMCNESRDCDRIIKLSFGVFCTLGLFFTIVLVVFAEEICEIIGSKTAFHSIIAVAPSIFLTTVVAIFRGYYQGNHDMSKTAISQLIEAVTKLTIGYFFAKYLIMQGFSVHIASAGAIFGVTVGTFFSALYLCLCSIKSRKKTTLKPRTSYKNISKKLFSIVVPITVGATVISLTGVVDMLTILKRLMYIGVSFEKANEFFGAYNMSLTLYNLPQTVITAISISIIPMISENLKNMQKVEKIVNSALFVAITFAMPCSVGFVLMSRHLLDFLYYKRQNDVIMATPILVILGLAVVFVSIVSITNASLQAISKPFVAVGSMTMGIFVKFIANYFLISIPVINISGAPLSTVLCFLTISILNLRIIRKYFEINLGKIFAKPIFASVFMGIIIKICENYLDMQKKISTLVLIGIGGVSYFAILILIKGIKKEDMSIFLKKDL